MNKPWLSILIPTYNGEAYLSEALNSILIQNDLDIECIIVDDGSTDSTLSIIKNYQDKLPIKLIQRERQGNWVKNTNYALLLANTNYICLLHQDDIWLPNRLKIMKKIIEENPEVTLFLHPSNFIDIGGKSLLIWQCPLPAYPKSVDSSLILERLLIQNFISIPAPIFKQEAAIKVKGLDEKLWYTADWDFWLKISALGKIMYYPKPLSAFRIHPSSQTIRRSAYIQDFRQQLEIVLKNHINSSLIGKKSAKKLKKVAKFSIEVNTALAAIIHGNKINFFKIILQFIRLTPLEWYQYWRDSRIGERVLSRIKAKLSA